MGEKRGGNAPAAPVVQLEGGANAVIGCDEDCGDRFQIGGVNLLRCEGVVIRPFDFAEGSRAADCLQDIQRAVIVDDAMHRPGLTAGNLFGVPNSLANGDREEVDAANFTMYLAAAGIGHRLHDSSTAVGFTVTSIDFGGVAAKVDDRFNCGGFITDGGKSARKFSDGVGGDVRGVDVGIGVSHGIDPFNNVVSLFRMNAA